MPGRFDLRPLLRALEGGLRKRRDTGVEPPDTRTRAVLIVLPLLIAGAAAGFGFVLPHADQLIAGTALLMGALLAAFTQVAGWRERLLTRSNATDGVDLRALNEAAAHILDTVMVALGATSSLVVLANLDLTLQHSNVYYALALKALTALGVAAFIYITISMVIVVNLLWDAYEKSGIVQPQNGAK